MRKRHLENVFKELMSFSPLVGILGHRQVGKTTFLELNSKTYLSFDDIETLKKAKFNSKLFLSELEKPATAIDESQLCPSLFPSLKERVRRNKTPGQFILSGSVRFTSKKSIEESLTGRIQYIDLLPFSIAEIETDPLGSKLESLFSTPQVYGLEQALGIGEAQHLSKLRAINNYLLRGGLPGVCFIRNEKFRNDRIRDQLRTILDRDLRQIFKTQLSYDVLFEFLVGLAKNEGRIFRFEDWRRNLGLSPVTQKKILYAFESIFLIRPIPLEGDKKGRTYILEDQGESHYLAEGLQSRAVQLLHLIYRNLRCEYFYRTGSQIKTCQFNKKSGSQVPLVFKSQKGVVGFIYSDSRQVDRRTKAAAGTFLRHYSNSRALVVHEGKEFQVIDDRTVLCPITWLI